MKDFHAGVSYLDDVCEAHSTNHKTGQCSTHFSQSRKTKLFGENRKNEQENWLSTADGSSFASSQSGSGAST